MEGETVGVSKEAVDPFPFSVMTGEQEEPGSNPELEDTEQESISDSNNESGQNVVPDLEVRKDDFCTEQIKDSTLTKARENIKTIIKTQPFCN